VSKFAVSYSRLNTFKNCPRQFEYLYILKSVKDEGNIHTEYGERVHKSLEMYGKTLDTAHLTAETRKFKPAVDMILKRFPHAEFEYQMAINADEDECSWFDSDTWVRGILDVLAVEGSNAFVADWKTGKVKPDPEQLKMFASLVFKAYPEVDTVTSVFIWLKFDETTPVTYKRDQANILWAGLERRIDAVQEAVDTGVFPAKPSGLCPWCAAKDVCPDAKLRR